MSYESLVNKINPSLFTVLGFLIFTAPFIVITFDVFYPFYFDKSDLILYSYILGYCAGMTVINELLHVVVFQGRTIVMIPDPKERGLVIIALKYYHGIIALITSWLIMTICSLIFDNCPEYLFWLLFSIVLAVYKYLFKELTVNELKKRRKRNKNMQDAKLKVDNGINGL